MPQGGHDYRGTGGNIIQQLIRFRGGLTLINPRETHGRIHDETGDQRRPSAIQDFTSAAVSLVFPWLESVISPRNSKSPATAARTDSK